MDSSTEQDKPKENSPYPISTDRRISSQALLGQEGRVLIEHNGHEYLLRQTHAGKLILTK
ncbi:hemin uptake protein HemP [Trabulsiella odontotermitis]|uniref:Hemic uptake protein hemP n=1 Tax=Trabulsiella odontotermitis TaxID=379893 RepID=A0A0L0GJ11_9ENTR|nr:hemin uptake protein HemP [Trabulsiella odontotermitis]KNC88786.1 hemic uptake protein hemP [Trabulsiella odontotermitis]KNC94501.1 hemic uptake protein hemP [Trabulsiella odontotermitis]